MLVVVVAASSTYSTGQMYSIVGPVPSGSGWAASAEHIERMQGYTLQGQFVDEKEAEHILLFDSAWRPCHLAGCYNLPSTSLGMWDMAK